VQIGLFGKPIAWDLDQVCYKELVVTGSNASVPSSWLRAIQLMQNGQVRTEPLISDVYPVTEWQAAFDAFEAKRGVKMILEPVG
jgi:L-iditol 2-dehydrogenase